jgi:2-polyprenyl-3-methyl-5-hydroxy-6-metoxy-1,4-benzoquinol methylase
MALSMAIRKEAHRVVGVDVLDVYEGCLPQAQEEIGLRSLPGNLEFRQIIPGQELEQFGQFDVIYTWSVVEHIVQDMLVRALASIKTALKPNGSVFLQISPLYFSAGGSHLAPWVPEPWHTFRCNMICITKACYLPAQRPLTSAKNGPSMFRLMQILLKSAKRFGRHMSH